MCAAGVGDLLGIFDAFGISQFTFAFFRESTTVAGEDQLRIRRNIPYRKFENINL